MPPTTQGNELRSHWLLDPEITFLNHGSFGACPRPVLEAQRRWQDRLERQPVQLLARDLEPLLDQTKRALGAFVGAKDEDLALVANATTGVNAVVSSLPFAAGDEILLTDQGYNACTNAVRRAARRADARVVVAALPFPLEHEDQVVEAVLRAATPRTRLALLDHVTSPTGLVLPIARLVKDLRERGIDTLVDGAHAPGMVDLDIEALGCAYYTGNCHKWMCSPKGAAFLWVRSGLQPRIRPVTISHGANSTRTDRSRFRLEFDWTGTDDPSAWLCIPEAIAFLGKLLPGGWPELRARNRALALRARALLCDRLAVKAPAPEGMIGSLAAVPLPDGTPGASAPPGYGDALQQRLVERDRIEVPIVTWPKPPRRLVRISAQAYNAEAEYARLAEALTLRLGEGC